MESFRGIIRRGVASCKGRDHGCGLLTAHAAGFRAHRSLLFRGDRSLTCDVMAATDVIDLTLDSDISDSESPKEKRER